jgi:hypothetical protein
MQRKETWQNVPRSNDGDSNDSSRRSWRPIRLVEGECLRLRKGGDVSDLSQGKAAAKARMKMGVLSLNKSETLM